MTTIAYRDGILAFDSAMTLDHLRLGAHTKAWRYKDFFICGAGSYSEIQAFKDWFMSGMNGESPYPTDEGVFVIITPDRKVLMCDPSGWFVADGPYHAWGSGMAIALGAMAAGASAIKAVEAACEIDVYSHGPVRRFIQ